MAAVTVPPPHTLSSPATHAPCTSARAQRALRRHTCNRLGVIGLPAQHHTPVATHINQPLCLQEAQLSNRSSPDLPKESPGKYSDIVPRLYEPCLPPGPPASPRLSQDPSSPRCPGLSPLHLNTNKRPAGLTRIYCQCRAFEPRTYRALTGSYRYKLKLLFTQIFM